MIRLRKLPASLAGIPAPKKGKQGKAVPPPLEKAVQAAVLEYLFLIGIKAFRVNSGAMRATYKGKTRYVAFNAAQGCSDVLGLIPGAMFNPPLRRAVFLAIEVKREGGQATEKQQRFLAMVNNNGGIAFVARSVQDVVQALAAEGVTT